MSANAPRPSVSVNSAKVTRSDEGILASEWNYESTTVRKTETGWVATPESRTVRFETDTNVPRVGVMLVGLGGNNGCTLTGAILANSRGMEWETRTGMQKANYLGSITQASTVRLGVTPEGDDVYVPMNSMLPMLDPNNIVVGGWDISSMNLADALDRSAVLEPTLKSQLRPLMQEMVPLPSIYIEGYAAANQDERADNLIKGTRQECVDQVRADIRGFKEANSLDKVIVLWTATTERFVELEEGVNDTAANLLQAISADHDEVSPSTLFAVASVLEDCAYINGSPQNTLVPGLVELASERGVFVAGDDFKSGQTKMKSVLVDFLVSAGIKPTSIVSYNHLGNNDGKNLSAPRQFRSKEISKSNVVDDVVGSNELLYPDGEHPDHCVVIKYVPGVGDSKRAMDEYVSEIFMGGTSTIAIHNTCEDSLLAAPLIIDLVVLTELAQRISIYTGSESAGEEPEKFHSVLSILGYLLKAPAVPPGTPVVHALFPQRACIVNLLRACAGLPADNNLGLEHKVPSMMAEIAARRAASDSNVVA